MTDSDDGFVVLVDPEAPDDALAAAASFVALHGFQGHTTVKYHDSLEISAWRPIGINLLKEEDAVAVSSYVDCCGANRPRPRTNCACTCDCDCHFN